MCNKPNAHVLIKEQNTHPQHHTRWQERFRIQSSIYNITVLWCTLEKDFTIHRCLSHIPLWKSVARVFESINWRLWAAFLSAVCFGMAAVNKLKNGSCTLPGSVSADNEVLSTEKMKQVLWLACFFKMQKLIVVGTTTRKCWLLTRLSPSPPPSLPSDTCTYMHVNDHFT